MNTNSSLLTPNCILITGGCGFIGVNFLDFMLKKGFTKFRILDNLSVGSIESLESMLSEHGKYEKKEESNRIFYKFFEYSHQLSSEIEETKSLVLSPQSSSYNEASQSFDLSPESSSRSEVPKSSVLSPQSSQAPRVEFVLGDIRKPKDCNQAAEGVESVIHLAAQSGVPNSVENPMLDCEINIMGTLNMLEACRKNNADKFVFASSGAPLGEVEPPIHEEKVPRPVSPYGASKLAGEAYCNAYYKTFEIKTVVLRFGNVYGPRSNHKTSVVAKFFKHALEGKPLEIYGDGSQTRDFIYVEDLCNAIYLSLKALGFSPQFYPVKSESHLTGASVLSPNHVAGEIFQIATFKETTVDEIASKIKDLANNGTKRKIKIIYGQKRLGDVKRNFSDISKAINLLGFKPEYKLQKGLLSTWKAFTCSHNDTDRVNKT